MTEKLHGLQQALGAATLEWVSYGLVALSVALLVFYFASNRSRSRGSARGGHAEAWLEDVSGASDQQKVELDGKRSVVIGRVAAKHKNARNFVVPQSTVGRTHAVIDFHDGAFWLNDQNSTNGTFVNGKKLEQPHRLKDGDMVMFHQYPFRFISRQDAPDGDKTVIAGDADVNEATRVATVAQGGGAPQASGSGFQKPAATEGQYPVNEDYESALDNLVSKQKEDAAPPRDYDKNAGTVHQAQALADNFKGDAGQEVEDLTLDNFIDDNTLSRSKRGKKR